ncbi:Beta-fructofuranosidase [Heracleum sosnowskyi]|uniref:Beta-fructofuranosidase n=1 Tax=Heracleum sosnowskyi TaxID=360622 RepID=A0AAD8H5Z3_9APIA|nr:Beta-fructofuranosidase [Heracleum sosnowskyi]
MTLQKVVIRVTMVDQNKSRVKAMKIAVTAFGVESVALSGDSKDQIEVIGEGIDVVELTKLLRKKIGSAELLSVGPAQAEDKKDEKKNEASVFPLVEQGSVLRLNIGSASQLDIVATFDVDEEAPQSIEEADADYSCTSSGVAVTRGVLGPFGFLVLADESLTELTAVYFYIGKGIDGRAKTHFCADQSRSSSASDTEKLIYGSDVPVLHGEKLSMRLLVDHSIAESFVQGGRRVITSRVYPTKAINGAAKVYMFNNATGTSVTASVKVWQMNSANLRPYPLTEDQL